MKALKIIGKFLLCLLIVGCLGINVWHIYIATQGEQKVVSNTYEVGLQKLENSDETKYFIEVNYLANEDNSGLELFEIKFNYMLDENQEAFYSQGLQYVAVSEDVFIDFDYYVIEGQGEGIYLGETASYPNYYYEYGFWGAYDCLWYTTDMYNYASSDDYEHVSLSTNPISEATRFKIQLGDDLFLMKFKNENTEMTRDNFQYSKETTDLALGLYNKYGIDKYYAYKDCGYFCKLLFEAVKSLPAGTNSAMVFEFGDIFDYFEYDEEKGQYSDTALKDATKLIADMKSYYSIKVTTSASGAKSSSDSIFGAVNGSTTYGTSEVGEDDYFVGRSYVNVTEDDFNLVEIEPGYCVLKLKEDFVNAYSKYDTIILKVNVNLDTYKAENIEILGFANDSGLSNFKVSECNFIETIDGEIVTTEVAYA